METIKPLNPIALELGPLSIHWYGIIIGTGLLLGLYIATNEAVKRGLQKEVFTDLVLWAVPIALICARIYYVIFNWSYYSQHPNEIIAIWKGGIAIHGALIGAIVTTVVFAKKKNLSFWKLADIAAPSIILGQAIGRWGNFMNQEAHGGPVSREFLESLHLPDFIINQMYIEGSYYHPTFLYESLWDLIGFLILLILQRLNLKRGEVFLTYVIWYSIGRFFIEGMRTDSLMLTDNLKMAQVLSVVLVITSTVLILYRRTRKGLTARYKD
ncbi:MULTISPECIES: prolipoprotein diacylglyceryl transferase [Anoxybacillaceae]|uniref:Phosphatidylglycerol--prolipoprotein diacylglyceryl transferase n=4 Tax=Anoxybacillaceae TaxID=3120669 RepID=A0A023DJK6_9BACL|nr:MULTISPECIES: prolipoprotein diacylglyceryl transferase [Bacillaceae]AMX83192.1 prolipoprotein diacylglyceryl transferase [Geobacillus subterraneus]ANB58343.1 prolipoprotein diacylglyceryl transferase [Anoxybacillus sp. B2M1]ANB66054.1 prolipoprotein diacylglyceryl transferase [Anoxybacillus sp. B7M1]MBB3854072.1 phosphatidylglycerol:prolipoprotein diacylglycerol transferase [Parageobacillus caldoxylosilyticus]MBB3907370.1 phosphatidylglycerol:prolipoprotein diacylglycerol transferase [Anox